MDGDFEVYDLELDATFEAWSGAQGDGPRLTVPSLGQFKNIETLVVRGYSNTFSVRAGGAYNFEALDGVFSARAGSYFDSTATSSAYTRLDFDTLAKIAGTLGFGYARGAFGLDVGYAAVASLPRVVGTGQGDVRPIDNAKNGKPIDSKGNLLPAVNEGAYRGFTHILAVGLSVTFDELFGAGRTFTYGHPYEKGYVGDDSKPPPKDRDKKPETKPDPDAKPDPKPETKPEPKPETKPEPKPETKPEPKPETKPVPKPEMKPVPKPVERIPEKRHEWWEDLEN